MKEEILYLKMEQSTDITKKQIFLRDLGTVYCRDKKIEDEVKNTLLYTIAAKENKTLIFSIMKVVEVIEKQYPGIQIENLGESDFIVNYIVGSKKPSTILEWIKTGLVCLIAFFGAAFSIMTFNTDVSVQEVFSKVYLLVTGESRPGGTVVELGYSVGLGIGILVFFNHFSHRKVETDPTPIQIQMRSYEKDINEALIKDAQREGKNIDIS